MKEELKWALDEMFDPDQLVSVLSKVVSNLNEEGLKTNRALNIRAVAIILEG